MGSVQRSRLRRTFFVGKMIIYLSIFLIVGVVVILWLATSEEEVPASGTVQPRDYREVHATEAGVLVDVKFKSGETVKAGELLAQLDDKKLCDELARRKNDLIHKKNQIAESEAQLAVLQIDLDRLKKDPAQADQYRFARTELEVAEKEVEAERTEVARAESLVRDKVAAQAELDREKVKLEQALGRLKTAQEKVKILDLNLSKEVVAKAQAELALQQKRLDSLKEELKTMAEELQTVEGDIERCRIKAPLAGEIVYSSKKPGEAVAPGELIFTVAQGSSAEVHAFVAESQILKVAPNQMVRIYPKTFDNREYGEARGKVSRVFPSAENVAGVSKVEVRIVVTETPLALKFGTNVDAYIVVNKDTLWNMLWKK